MKTPKYFVPSNWRRWTVLMPIETHCPKDKNVCTGDRRV